MSAQGPRIILPGGYQSESGLYLPTQLPVVPAAADVPTELRPGAELMVVAQAPSFIDQVWVFATQEELGLEPTPLEVVLRTVHEIPFWPAMKMLARFQRDPLPV